MDTRILHDCIDFLKEYDHEHSCSTYKDEIWIEEFENVVEETIPVDEIDLKFYFTGIQEAFTLFLSKGSSSRWEGLTLEEREQIVKNLLDSSQIQQRTTEWYTQSKKLLTASEFSHILGSPRSMAALALQKAAPVSNTNSGSACSTASMSAFDWGIRFEPVVKQVLENLWTCEIAEVGRFVHLTDSRLAASPDGIILRAADPARACRLLEIKCPIRREINGTIPFDYWCQMQIQMEVTGIDECEYVEMKIMSQYKDSPYDTTMNEMGQKYNGKIWLFQCFETCETKYAYNAIQKKDYEFLGWNCLEEIPWHLEKFFTETVYRDKKWFEGTRAKQEEFWLRVQDAHNGLIEPPKRRNRTPSVNVCQITDDVT
jgi:YqaJ-like viral recombinase domain